MELFNNAKVVRLRSHHDKYLLAEDDQESVSQDRDGSGHNARWSVEFVDGLAADTVIRLKSCYNKYLTASEDHKLLGMTGKKVVQTKPRRLDSSVEWEPVREGFQVRLKTRYGHFLRANGGLPPWRNSITHDIPHRTATQDWVLWDVEVVESQPRPVRVPSIDVSNSKIELRSPGALESTDSFAESPPKDEGRIIYFHVADDYGNVEDEGEGVSFNFKGSGLEELTHKLEEETGLEGIIVCTRSPLNGNLYPLLLDLPPNNTTMHVVVVKSSSKG
ncbi:hypothetical protein Scep_017554 [Stephania cephalantha]|uniref:DUF569 domain-containing protein n=1 Tax=Stephania cephalantha TaxID=152367 RepID=A0AAP0IRM2_9MAGN